MPDMERDWAREVEPSNAAHRRDDCRPSLRRHAAPGPIRV